MATDRMNEAQDHHFDSLSVMDSLMSRLLASQSGTEEDNHQDISSDYVSVIKFNGQPIPPPVLSLSCRLEMQSYKEAAIKKEREIMERRRLTLLDTVQGIVDTLEVRKRGSRESTPPKMEDYTDTDQITGIQTDEGIPPQTQEFNNQMDMVSSGRTLPTMPEHTDQPLGIRIDMTLPDLSATQLQQYNKVIESMERENYQLESRQEDTNDLSPQSVPDTRHMDDVTSIERNNLPKPHTICSDTTIGQPMQQNCKEIVPPQSISSSIASSQDSALNSTVIAAEGMEALQTVEGVDSPVQSIAVDKSRPDLGGFFPSLCSTSTNQDVLPVIAQRPTTPTTQNTSISTQDALHSETSRPNTRDGFVSSVIQSSSTTQEYLGVELSTLNKDEGYFPSLQSANAITNQDISLTQSATEDQPAHSTTIASQNMASTEASTSHTEGYFPSLQNTAALTNKVLLHTRLETTAPTTSHSSLNGQYFGQAASLKLSEGLRDSWGDSESNLSLLGEYHLLPTPIPPMDNSNSPDSDISNPPTSVAAMPNPPMDNTNAPAAGTGPNMIPPDWTEEEDDRMKKSAGDLTTDDLTSLIASDKDCLTLSGILMTRSHTLDTVAQSCTLPLSLFGSMGSNSTLCEVQDPFSSITNIPTELVGEDLKIEGHTRAAPVGQEANDTTGCNATPGEPIDNASLMANNSSDTSEIKVYDSKAYTTPIDEFKLPRKRVRRNSYTLEHPSPALLDAKARNEAPYASDEGSPVLASGDDKPPSTVRRSLDLEGDDGVVQRAQSGLNQERLSAENQHDEQPSSSKVKDSPVLTEDNLLRLQLEQFESIRRQLEQKQREQIEEMLLQQQQEQLALENEMSALQLRVTQKDSSKVYASVFGLEPSDNGDMSNGTRQFPVDYNTANMMMPVKRGSDTTNPSLKDSLENAMHPPATIFTNSYRTADIRNYSSFVMQNTDTEIRDTSASSKPFYLQDGNDISSTDMDRSMPGAWTPSSDRRNQKAHSPSMQAKFDRISAAVKGYLTRRLMKTHKVQDLMTTIRDTVYFVDDFQAETPIKQGKLTVQDVDLAGRLLSQLSTARNELYDTFQSLSAKERMAIISQSRALDQQQLFRSNPSPMEYTTSRDENNATSRPLSAATRKVLERKNKAKNADNKVPSNKQPSRSSAPKVNKRPKSALNESRVLKPIHGNQSPPRPKGAPFRMKTSTSSGDVHKPKAVIHRVNNNKNMRNSAKSVPSNSAKSVSSTNSARSVSSTNSARSVSSSSAKPVSTSSAKSVSTSSAVNTNDATEKRAKNVRRSLYPVTTKGPAKGPTKGTNKGTKQGVVVRK